MKKVLIITFRYPPCKETGANRPLSWARYLHNFNYKPVIVTREWQHPQVAGSEYLYKTSDSPVPLVEKHDTHEVYYLPFKGTYRTRYFMKNGVNTVYKLFSLLDKVLNTLGIISFSEYKSLYTFSNEYLKKNPDVKHVIITGGPFELFRFGPLLCKSNDVKWIADYRDPWTTDEVPMGGQTTIHKIIYSLEKRAELRWCSTASYVTCVSEYLTKKIVDFLHVPGEVIYNGFFNLPENTTKENNDISSFRILFNGTLYPFHQIEVFLDGFKLAVDKYKGTINLIFQAIGIKYNQDSSNRVEDYMKGYESNVQLTHRVSAAEYQEIQNHAQLLVIFGSGVAGITSSKIFDYISVPKPVLHSPNDKDVVEKILKETGQGIFADTPEEVLLELSKLVDEFITKRKIDLTYNSEAALVYSRENQTKKLAKLLDKI